MLIQTLSHYHQCYNLVIVPATYIVLKDSYTVLYQTNME